MQQEPRPAIHMEKQLGWARELGGAGSLGIFKAGQTIFARLMESQIWRQLIGSMGREFRKGTMASAHLDARHLSLPLHATGAPQATSLVLEPRGSESV